MGIDSEISVSDEVLMEKQLDQSAREKDPCRCTVVDRIVAMSDDSDDSDSEDEFLDEFKDSNIPMIKFSLDMCDVKKKKKRHTEKASAESYLMEQFDKNKAEYRTAIFTDRDIANDNETITIIKKGSLHTVNDGDILYYHFKESNLWLSVPQAEHKFGIRVLKDIEAFDRINNNPENYGMLFFPFH